VDGAEALKTLRYKECEPVPLSIVQYCVPIYPPADLVTSTSTLCKASMATVLTCSACGSDLEAGNPFCSRCGAGVYSCKTCGKTLAEGDGFCSTCGTPAGSSASYDPDTSSGSEAGSAWAEVVQRLRRATQGEFEIGRELGRGAMAAVFLAHEVSLDRKVAIKVMSPGLLMDEGMAERFRREAITIANLNHPNIVSVHSVRQAQGLHFFVMRHIRGRSLEQVIQKAGRLPIPIVRSVLFQVASALSYAHRSGVVHRDIKPANILIDEDGNAVVTDFGIAKVAELPSETHPGALIGTPAYMSPEQCTGDEVSGASDQYALGAVAYEMITGVAPFTGSTLTVMQAHLEQPPEPVRSRSQDCPPELEAVVLRMLEKDPAARWPSIAQARTAAAATPLAEDDPLLAELCRLATPDSETSRVSVPSRTTPGQPLSSRRTAAPTGLVRTISILPPPDALETGDSFTLVAMLRGERGVLLPGRPVEWATDTPEVLRIDSRQGVATAVAPGSARLTATCEGVLAALQVQVAPPAEDADAQPRMRVAAIQLSAPPKSVKAGDSFVLTATPVDYRGGVLLGHTVQWSTSDVGVAVVTASGWVATLGQGPVVLQATCNEASASVRIDVEEAARPPKRVPQSLPKPKAAQPPTPAPVEMDRPIRRRRTRRSGQRWLFTALAIVLSLPVIWLYGGLGNRIITSSGARPQAADAFVPASGQPVPAIQRGSSASVRIIRRPRQPLVPGVSRQMLAEVRDNTGQTLSGSRVSWLSTDHGVARVDSATGWVRAVGPGRATVIATSGKWRDSAAVIVRRASPRSPDPASLSSTAASPLQPGGNTVAVSGSAHDGNAAPPAAAESTSNTNDSGSALPGVDLPQSLAGQGYEPEFEPADEEEPAVQSTVPVFNNAERSRREAWLLTAVEQCYEAIRSRDVARLEELYRPESESDHDKLSRLKRILSTDEWAAVVGERINGERHLAGDSPSMEFSFQLVWKDAFGGRLTSRPVFRTVIARRGSNWGASGCRIVGTPKL
jgi:serine/threonine protein kinase